MENRPYNPISGVQPAAPSQQPVQPQATPQTPSNMPPAQPTQPQSPAADPKPLTTEIVDAIPLRQPGQPMQDISGASPVMQMPAYNNLPPAGEDELDKILKAVNDRVKSPAETPQAKKKTPIVLLGRLKNISVKLKKPKPIAPIVLAVLVFCLLAATAVIAYRQGASKKVNGTPGIVGTSSASASTIEASGGLLVRPNDLDDFSQDLQTKMSSLNDSQDFSSSALGDQALGL